MTTEKRYKDQKKIMIFFLREMIYFESISGSDWQFPDHVISFQGNCVHANGKYCYIGLILKNSPFNRILNVQFSGHLLVSFFITDFRFLKGRKVK